MAFKTAYRLGIQKLFLNSLFGGPKARVLCFHRVNPEPHALFPPLNPKVFKQLIRLLKANFEITSLNALKAPDFLHKIKKPPLVLSLDDGYRDFLEYALPILMDEKVPVNQNIVVHSAETGNLIWTQRFII